MSHKTLQDFLKDYPINEHVKVKIEGDVSVKALDGIAESRENQQLQASILRKKRIDSIFSKGNNYNHFISLMSAIASASIRIAELLNKPALLGVLGETGSVNVQGEHVQKLDDLSNNIFVDLLTQSRAVCALGSEEEENFLIVDTNEQQKCRIVQDEKNQAEKKSEECKQNIESATCSTSEQGRFVVFFDPLDGSSNIDVNISVGTIFSVFYMEENLAITKENLLQAGKNQVAGGYVTYGAATILVFSMGNGVHGFTLNRSSKNPIEQFIHTHPNCIVPSAGKYYSANLGNYNNWEEGDQKAIDAFQAKSSLRYVGSLIADFHRTLLCGGVFSYPVDKKTKKGKLRLLYEAAPLAFLMEEAKGKAMGRDGRAILDIKPEELHQRVPFLFGSSDDVDFYLSHFYLSHFSLGQDE